MATEFENRVNWKKLHEAIEKGLSQGVPIFGPADGVPVIVVLHPKPLSGDWTFDLYIGSICNLLTMAKSSLLERGKVAAITIRPDFNSFDDEAMHLLELLGA